MTTATERLLADHRAGRLVVDVEVAGRLAQLLEGVLQEFPTQNVA